MNITRFSVRNPVLVNLMTILIIGVGTLVYVMFIRREVFPKAEIGAVLVTTVWQGATPEDVEREVTIPLEKEIARIDGIDEMQSMSAEGISTIFVRLTAETNIDKAVLDIQAEVDKARLPADVDEAPVVREIEFSLPVATIAVYLDPATVQAALARSTPDEIGEDGLPFALERRINAVAEDLELALRQIPDVDNVDLQGTRERRIFVATTPDNLQQFGVSLGDIAAAVRMANASTPAGSVDTGREEINLRAGTLFADHPTGIPAAVRRVVVKTGQPGSGVAVGQVGTVIDGFEDLRIRSRVYVPQIRRNSPGEALQPEKGMVSVPAILLMVHKRDSADSIRVSDRVNRFIDDWRENLPDGVRMTAYADRSIYIKDRIAVVESNGLFGLAIVMFVLFFFLNYRMAFMTALGIPISLMGTMIVLYAFDYSVNLLSMFGMVIALGMVVDEGIIICENAYRYMEKGMPPLQATLRGASEVIGPVVASVLTTMAAFLPLLLWGGVTGQFMAVIPVGVIAALTLSLVEALMVLPSHLAEWSHNPGRPHTFIGQTFDRAFAWTDPARRWFQRQFDAFRGFYVWVLIRALRWRYAVVALVMLAFVGSAMLALSAGTAFMDAKRIDRFMVFIEVPKGATVVQTGEAISSVERIVNAVLPAGAIGSIQTTVGTTRNQAQITMTGKNIGQLTVELMPPGDYRALYGNDPPYDFRTDTHVETWMDDIRTRLSRLSLADFQVIGEQGGPPQGSDVEVRLRGENYAELVAVSEALEDELKQVRGLRDVTTDVEDPSPEFKIEIDEQRARNVGVTPDAVQQTIRAAFDGAVATTVTDNVEEIDVVVRMADTFRQSRADILKLDVPTADGRQRVPLKDLVTRVTKVPGRPTIKRFDEKRAVVVSAMANGITVREANALAAERVQRILGGRGDITASYEGSFAEETEGFTNLGLFALIAAALIYAILAAVLRSFMQPFLIMSAVPLAFIGVALGLFLFGEKVTVISMVGAVALIGIVVNDSTVLVDFVNRQRREGESRWTALVRGSKLRLRPILLTTLTTIAGLASITYAPYLGFEGDTFLAPMGIAISWGLTFATMLTLLVVPCLYAMYEDWMHLVGIDPTKGEQTSRELEAFDREMAGTNGHRMVTPGMAAGPPPAGPAPKPPAETIAPTREGLPAVVPKALPEVRRPEPRPEPQSEPRIGPDPDVLARARSQRKPSAEEPPRPDNYTI